MTDKKPDFAKSFCIIISAVVALLLIMLIYCVYVLFFNARVDILDGGKASEICPEAIEELEDQDEVNEVKAFAGEVSDTLETEEPVADLVEETKPEWEFDGTQDLQMPELPTGCEATAFATLCRMNGFDITKFQVADALPKSDHEFVNSFWGDPYSPNGWACMSPAIYNTGLELLADEDITIVLYDGVELSELPVPCEIWVTINMENANYSNYQINKYKLSHASHAVVMTNYSDDVIDVVDPLVGVTQYPTEKVETAYNHQGQQAVYITDESLTYE